MQFIIEYIVLIVLLAGCDLSSKPGASAPSVVEVPQSVAAQKAKANAELFHEVWVTVLMREPQDRAQERGEFGSWVDSLNQGASLEGVYNGLINGSEYQTLERSASSVTPDTLEYFKKEYQQLATENGAPIRNVHTLSEIQKASVYQLKKWYGEALLQVISTKAKDRQVLATWYSKWVTHMAERKVDFGIPLRNDANEAFHLKWALENSEDRLKWEALNRIHRVLNKGVLK